MKPFSSTAVSPKETVAEIWSLVKCCYHTLSFSGPHACPTNSFSSCLLGSKSAYPSAESGLLLSELQHCVYLSTASRERSRIEKKCVHRTPVCVLKPAHPGVCKHLSHVQLIPTGGGRQEWQGHVIAASLVILSFVPLSSSKVRLQNECNAAVYPSQHFTYNAKL